MPANPRPDFSGFWTVDFDRSILRGTVPHKIVISIDHREPNLLQRLLIVTAPGTQQITTFCYEVGADVTNTISGNAARSHAQWHGHELLIESWMTMHAREFHYKDYWSLSPRGDILTMAHRDDDLSGQICVLQKSTPDEAARFEKC